MRTLSRLMLSDFGIPFEEIVDKEIDIVKYCIPDYKNAVAVMTCWDDEIELWLSGMTYESPMENLTEREALEYILLYLLQRHSNLMERVLFTPLNRNDPEHLIATLIEDGLEDDMTPDNIANKIITFGLLFDIREMINTASKELTYESRRQD